MRERINALALVFVLTAPLASLVSLPVITLVPRQQIVVVNPYGALYSVKIIFANGDSKVYSSTARELRIPVAREPARIIFVYALEGINITYTVIPKHSAIIYLTTFPAWLRDVSVGELTAYSWHDYPWPDAPWGLEIMVGTEGCYVEEAVAGRIFNLFYGFAYEHVKDILDELGISDEHTRYEIAATALWAAQLVREVKGCPPDYGLCYRAAVAILVRHYGWSRWRARLAACALLPLCTIIRHADNATLYRAVLHAVKSVEDYVAIFPEWEEVDEEHWVEMCTGLERYTVYPALPTYVHVLLAGAYAVYVGGFLGRFT